VISQKGASLKRVVTCLFALAAFSARADFDLYGYGPRAAAMGGAMTAEVNDYAAVFYNPAAMGGFKQVNTGFQFQYTGMLANVESKDSTRPVKCDYCRAPSQAAFALGMVLPFPGKAQDHVAFGMGFYLPGKVMLRLQAPSREEPYWYQYQSGAERLQMQFALGFRIFDWLKFGAGVSILANLVGDSANVGVDLFSKQITHSDINAYLGTRVAPIFSLHSTPLPWMRFGATFRYEMQVDYRIPANVDLEGIGVLGFVITGTSQYQPHTLQFGAAFDIIPQLTVSVDGIFQAWSRAPSPYMGVGIDLSGPTLEGLGLGSALDVSSVKQPPGFSDTFGGKLGVEARLHERFTVRGGTFIRPTPVPKQDTAGTNLMDNTTVGASLGVSANFPDPTGLLAHPIIIEVTGQSQFVLKREANKSNIDSTPSYTYSATMLGLMAATRYDF